jgi:hypothetical protein
MTTNNTNKTTVQASDAIKTMSEQIVCIDLAVAMPGTHRKVDTGVVNKTDAIDDRLGVSKRVLKAESLAKVGSIGNAARYYMKQVQLPTRMYRNGLYPISVKRLQTVSDELESLKVQFNEAVTAFLDEYAPTDGSESPIIARDREELKSLFESSDYPTRAQMASKFGFAFYFVSLSTPDSLKTISKAFFEKEREREQQRIKAAADDLIVGMRVRMKELVDSMVDRLTPDEGGERKRFLAKSTIGLAEFLKALETDNILNDAELNGLASKASALLQGIDPKVIRDDDKAAADFRQEFATIGDALGSMVTEGRSFDFD